MVGAGKKKPVSVFLSTTFFQHVLQLIFARGGGGGVVVWLVVLPLKCMSEKKEQRVTK